MSCELNISLLPSFFAEYTRIFFIRVMQNGYYLTVMKSK